MKIAVVHLCLLADSATPLSCDVDGEHRTTSLYLTEVLQLVTMARSGCVSSSDELRRRQWISGSCWTSTIPGST
jgi:hypothetical protein